MTIKFEDRLQEFSDKHGAVLVGMHNELRHMVQRIEVVEEHSAEAKKIAESVDLNIESHISKLNSAHAKKTKAMDSFVLEMRHQLSAHESSLKLQNEQAQALFQKGLELLREHKERDINLKQRELLMERWERRVVIGIAAFVVIVVSLLSYLVWIR